MNPDTLNVYWMLMDQLSTLQERRLPLGGPGEVTHKRKFACWANFKAGDANHDRGRIEQS